MPKKRFFISYRREYDSAFAGRIYDRLKQHFDPGNIFMDVDNIRGGQNFRSAIQNAINETDVFIAILGPRWLTITNEQGHRRLDEPNDFVRMEIEFALKRNIQVIPILLDNTKMPGSNELPDVLQELSFLHAIEVRHKKFDTDIRELIEILLTNSREGKPPPDSETTANQLRQSLNDLIEIIADYEVDKDNDRFSKYFKQWKEQTNPKLLSLRERGIIPLETDLYDVYADPHLESVYTRLKNEARKCQRLVMDSLKSLA